MKKSTVIVAAVLAAAIGALAAVIVNNITKEHKKLYTLLKHNLQQEDLSSYDESELGVSCKLPSTGDSTALYLYDAGSEEQVFETKNTQMVKLAMSQMSSAGIDYQLEKEVEQGDSTVTYHLRYSHGFFVPIVYLHLRAEDRNN